MCWWICGWADAQSFIWRQLLHDGSVDDGLDVVPSVPGVDHSLPLGFPNDVLVLKDAVETHVGCLGLETKVPNV